MKQQQLKPALSTPVTKMDRESMKLVADLKARDAALDAKLRREGFGNPPPFVDQIQRQTSKKGK